MQAGMFSRSPRFSPLISSVVIGGMGIAFGFFAGEWPSIISNLPTAFAASCGNGVLENQPGGETCDDNNTTNSDGCSSSCLNECVVDSNCPADGTPIVACYDLGGIPWAMNKFTGYCISNSCEWEAVSCTTENGLCEDNIDNDDDGPKDCADSNCSSDPACSGGGGGTCDNDGSVDAGETCSNCAYDVRCSIVQKCIAGACSGVDWECKREDICGDGWVSAFEVCDDGGICTGSSQASYNGRHCFDLDPNRDRLGGVARCRGTSGVCVPRGNDGCQADCQDICYPASWGCLSNADCCSGLSCSNGVCAAGGGGINTESCSYTTSFDGGDGNDPNASPYLISNCIQLQWICNEPTKFYKLAANVDCSGTASWNSGRGFDPIAGFDGSLNGNGFVISDLTINRPTTDEVGVFKRTLATSDTIWNVGLSNVSVVGRNYVGALVGRGAKYILRTYVTGSVSGESYVGGLAGEVIYSLSDTYSKATVTASVQIAGGLAGSLAGGSIERSYATGNVTAPAEAGGLIGYVDVPSVTGAFDSFATGNVSGAGTKGAVFGNSDDSVTTNVHWHDHAGNPDTCCDSGDSCSLNCAPQISVNYFYNSSNSPMNAWLFGVGGWQSGSTFPCLAWESSC